MEEQRKKILIKQLEANLQNTLELYTNGFKLTPQEVQKVLQKLLTNNK